MIDLSAYKLIIFDKDGTLIDFDAMWGGWVEGLAARLEAATGRPLAAALFTVFDYDSVARRTLAGGHLAVTPMAGLYDLTDHFLLAQGLSQAAAKAALHSAWRIPDPVTTAQPLADLGALFVGLRAQGLSIAIATSDDHAPTAATLANLGVLDLVDVLIAADDGVPLKPAPDMVYAACAALGVPPAQAIVIGDALPEMQMARAAGAGLAIAVSNGVTPAAQLAPMADMILPTVAGLLQPAPASSQTVSASTI